jgi:hypothetical protein
MRTPTIQTGSVVAPKMRLRLGKWMAIKNKMRDKKPVVLDDRDDLFKFTRIHKQIKGFVQT